VDVLIFSLLRDQKGATAIEYALIASLLSATIVFAIANMRTNLEELFNGVSENVATSTNS
jgi:pilus assembly protein Flp/PilA